MAGPMLALRRFTDVAFKKYRKEMIRILKERIRPLAYTSKDADYLLPDWTVTKLLQAARAALAAHIARKDNPHQETATTIGSYTETIVAGKFAAKVPNSIVPISTYGIHERLTAAQVTAAWTNSGFVLTCNRVMKAIISGTPYNMSVQSLTLAANKTYYIFIRLRFGAISYEAREDSPPESVSVMYIGTVTTNGTGIVSKSFAPVTRIDTFRISTIARGSVIPVTQGTLDTPTKFTSEWKPL